MTSQRGLPPSTRGRPARPASLPRPTLFLTRYFVIGACLSMIDTPIQLFCGKTDPPPKALIATTGNERPQLDLPDAVIAPGELRQTYPKVSDHQWAVYLKFRPGDDAESLEFDKDLLEVVQQPAFHQLLELSLRVLISRHKEVGDALRSPIEQKLYASLVSQAAVFIHHFLHVYSQIPVFMQHASPVFRSERLASLVMTHALMGHLYWIFDYGRTSDERNDSFYEFTSSIEGDVGQNSEDLEIHESVQSWIKSRFPHPLVDLHVYFRLLRVFSRLEFMTKLLCEEDFINLILKIMKSYKGDTVAQRELSAGLANLASNPKTRLVMKQCNALGLLVGNLKRFVEDGKIETEVCAVIANLATNGTRAVTGRASSDFGRRYYG